MRPWETLAEFEVERATLVRAMLEYREPLLEADPWVPFPQASCFAMFGPEAVPLPIGALFHLWDHCPEMTAICAICGGNAFAYTFTGLFSIGGVNGCCTLCDRKGRRPVGGFPRLIMEVIPYLDDTPYRMKGFLFMGAVIAQRLPLFEALQRLGVPYLPDSDWAKVQDKSEVSFSIIVPE